MAIGNKYTALSSALSKAAGTARDTGNAFTELYEKKRKKAGTDLMAAGAREGKTAEEQAATAYEYGLENQGLPLLQQGYGIKQANIAREDTQAAKAEESKTKQTILEQSREAAKVQLTGLESQFVDIEPEDKTEKMLLNAAKQSVASAKESLKGGGDYALAMKEANDKIDKIASYRVAKASATKTNDADSRLLNKAIGELTKVESPLRESTALLGTFKDDYTGFKASAIGDAAVAYKKRFGNDTDFVDWWQRYQEHKNDIRKSLFGSALTGTEKAEFDKAVVTPGMKPEQVKRNLERQELAAKIAASKIAKAYKNKGIDRETIDSYASNYGNFDWENFTPPDWYLGTKPKAGADTSKGMGMSQNKPGAIDSSSFDADKKKRYEEWKKGKGLQ